MEQTTEKKLTFFRFEDLRIYHKALDYVSWIHKITNDQTYEGACDIVDKFNHASHAIALNIAEGSARNKSQFIYYLKMAKSSVRECLVYTTMLANLDRIDELQEDESRSSLMEMTKMIGALISSLQRNNGNNESQDDFE